ncbi:LysR family transcriptional regulator [Pendulispora rubella]|uniref:LysR family transcriptional regulator n=1 Tax=Pendulispora rubella TaxID=2741070 RepID=A0ABZ2L576_9BACT
MDPLSQDQLQAFAAVARAGSFTRAAGVLHLSQPALSRRITALEQRLETTLLVRGRSGAGLTEAGHRLLDFVEAQRALEEELVGELGPTPTSYRGVVRIAGLSSLVPPVVLPALAPFLREHPAVQVEIHRELDRQVVAAVVAGRIDFGISQNDSNTPSVVDVLLGDEEFVMVESRLHHVRRNVFLDVSPSDPTTELFLASQPAHVRPRGRLIRSFLFDEPGILLGVELGLGRAVKPRHTVPSSASVRVDPSFVPQSKPVFLHYRRQGYYGRLHQAIRARIEAAVRERLATSAKRTRKRGSR